MSKIFGPFHFLVVSAIIDPQEKINGFKSRGTIFFVEIGAE